MSSRVLVVDDEPAMLRALGTNLRARGYDVDLAATGEQALELAGRTVPDVVVLDLGLPGIDGFEVLRGLRGWTNVPILVLSARSAQSDKVTALDEGADDYLAKPFGIDELLARIRALLRRSATSGAADPPLIETDDFTVDFAAGKVTNRSGDVRLTPIEWSLVTVLVRNEGKLVAHRLLLQQVWGPQYGEEANYLRVHMAHIRRKLEPEPGRPRYFITEPGIGYRFERTAPG